MSNTFIRPAWTPVTIAMMIIGFMIYWPLGLAMIAYIIWGDRLESVKTDINDATDRFTDGFAKRAQNYGPWNRAPSGNAAFDEWRDAEIERLAEERRKLEEMRQEFEDYSREMRRAKDQEEFERFMANRDAPVMKEAKKASEKPQRKSGGKKLS